MADEGRDRYLIDQSHQAYKAAALPRSEDKAFGFGRPPGSDGKRHGDVRFTALGTEVSDEPGLAAAPAAKRADLMLLTFAMLRLPSVETTILRRMIGLYIHPFMRRKRCMASFGRIFTWLHSAPEGIAVSWPRDVKDELLAAALCLPLATSHLRWDLDRRISCTDATPDHGGSTFAWVSKQWVRELYRFTEHRGCHARLGDVEAGEGVLLPAIADIADICDGTRWQYGRSHPFKRSAHINLQ